MLRKKSFIKVTIIHASLGFYILAAITSSSESTEAALGFPTVASAFDPGEEWARGEVAGPSFPGAYVVVRPLAKASKIANTCEKGGKTFETCGL